MSALPHGGGPHSRPTLTNASAIASIGAGPAVHGFFGASCSRARDFWRKLLLPSLPPLPPAALSRFRRFLFGFYGFFSSGVRVFGGALHSIVLFCWSLLFPHSVLVVPSLCTSAAFRSAPAAQSGARVGMGWVRAARDARLRTINSRLPASLQCVLCR